MTVSASAPCTPVPIPLIHIVSSSTTAAIYKGLQRRSHIVPSLRFVLCGTFPSRRKRSRHVPFHACLLESRGQRRVDNLRAHSLHTCGTASRAFLTRWSPGAPSTRPRAANGPAIGGWVPLAVHSQRCKWRVGRDEVTFTNRCQWCLVTYELCLIRSWHRVE